MFTAASVLFLGVLFLCSGLIVNSFQLLLFLLVLPFSRRAYRVVNMVLMDAYWSQLVWLVEWWGGLEIRVFADKADWAMIAKEHALLLSNHRSDVDWVVGWVLAQRGGCLGGTRALMKKSVQYLPVMGWSLWFSEYIFISRNWNKDRLLIEQGLKRLRDFPPSLWMALFAEGTRFTPAKLKAAQEFAASAGLPVPRNTLVPRTKGFVATVRGLRSFVPAVYDMTVMVPEGVPQPTFLGLVQRKKTVIHVYMERVPMSVLPEDDEGLADWLKKSFAKKDELLEAHKKSNTFGEALFIPTKPALSSLLVTLGWAALLSLAAAAGIRRALLTNTLTWKSIAVAAAVLFAVGGTMQRFLTATQSEHSTPVSKQKAKQPGHEHRD